LDDFGELAKKFPEWPGGFLFAIRPLFATVSAVE
jgi:hypothetical protein